MSSPDFRSLLSRPSGQAQRPKVLPAGDYPGVIKGHTFGKSPKQGTDYVRFELGLMAFPDGVEEDEVTGIDLAKRSQRLDFYMTEDALYRLDGALEGLGLELGRPYEEILQETTGMQVMVTVGQYLNRETGEVAGNEVKKIVGE